jgi:hypothetical protein
MVVVGLMLGIAGAVPGQAQGPAGAADPSLEQLKARVQAYWDARVKKDYRAEYDLLEPRERARVSPDEYGRGRNLEYTAAQVESVERRGNFARVAVRLLVKVTFPTGALGPVRTPTPRTQSALLDDYWVLVGGAWYRTEESDRRRPPPWPAG